MECKRTQSDGAFRDRQIGSDISQKLSVVFPPGRIGQRLISGLSIGIEDDNPSHLKTVNLVPEGPAIATESKLEFIEDTATRDVMTKLLRSAGFKTAAGTVAAPFGEPRTMPPLTKKTDRNHVEFLVDCDRHAREGLLGSISRRRLFSDCHRGREVVFQSPGSTYIRDGVISKVAVRQGIDMNAIDLLREQLTIETLINPPRNHWVDVMRTNVVQNDERTATLRIGDIFRSELILK